MSHRLRTLAAYLPVLAAAWIVPVRDPDVYWHLAMGRAIVATGSAQPPDPLSFTQEGAPFANLTWLWDLGAYGLWSVGGLPALQVLAAACLALGLILAVSWGRGSAWAGPLAAVALLGAFGRVFPRPDVLQLCLPVGMALAAESMVFGTGIAGFTAAIVLGLLWPHLHGSFPMGSVILAMWALEGAVRGRSVRRIAVAFVVSALAPVLHPMGLIATCAKVLMQVDRADLPVRITEWEPVDWGALGRLPLTTAHSLVLLAGVALLGALRRGRDTRWALVGIAGFYLAMACGSNRFEGAAAILLGAAAIASSPCGRPAWGFVAGIASLATVLLSLARVPAYGFGWGAAPSEEPAPILDALAAGEGRVLTDFDLGAVIGWRYAPGWKVSMDSRAEAFYDVGTAREYVGAMDEPEPFLSKWNPDAAVVHRRSGACAALSGRAGWRYASFNPDFAVFFLEEAPGPSALTPCGTPWINVERCVADKDPTWRAAAVDEAVRLAAGGDAFLLAQAGLVRRICGGDRGGLSDLDRAVELRPRDMLIRAARARALRVEGDPRWENDVAVLDALAPEEADTIRELGR